jgi:3-hydroxyisobutyrate dehydrogenase-like beta-hydroxyacid dehydrogenase
MDHLQRPDESNIPFSRPASPEGGHRVAFVGIGSMGYFMARNLASSAITRTHPLLIWNRSPEKTTALLEELGPDRIEIAKDVAQVAVQSEFILTNLANDAVVISIYQKLVSALEGSPPSGNKVFIEMSTIFPTLVCKLEEMVNRVPHGRLVTAPVFGAPSAADQAQLLIVTSGDYRSKKEIAHLLVPAIGRRIIDLGGNLEKAPMMKLVGNSVVLGMMETVAESFTLAEKAGIGAHQAFDLVKALFPIPSILGFSEKMINDQFDGTKGFALDGGIKDVQHIRRLTADYNSPMPAIDIVHQHLVTARALHLANKQYGTNTFNTLDFTSIIASSRISAGLDAFDTKKHEQLGRES